MSKKSYYLRFQGKIGVPGNNGVDGPSGSKGNQGPIGNPGQPGANGSPGDGGEAGRKGAVGIRGAQGPPGSSGPKGDKVLCAYFTGYNLPNASSFNKHQKMNVQKCCSTYSKNIFMRSKRCNYFIRTEQYPNWIL